MLRSRIVSKPFLKVQLRLVRRLGSSVKAWMPAEPAPGSGDDASQVSESDLKEVEDYIKRIVGTDHVK